MIRRMQNLNNWHVFYILVFITLATSIGSAFLNPELADRAWWSGFLQNFSTEMMGAIATFALFELIVGSRDEKKNLITQMRSEDKTTMLNAVEQLRANGWLQDGSLKGTDLNVANLEGANFYYAKLEGTYLNLANLQGADLREASLKGAYLWKANLEGANLWDANLEGTDLGEANLQGAKLKSVNLSGAKLREANLEGANLRNANLQSANLAEANLEHANMFGVKCDEETTLPNGEMWTKGVDWSKYGAVEIEGLGEWQAYRKEHSLGKSNA